MTMKPIEIPTDPAKFKAWADAACGAWPAKLQALAYAAWRELLNGETAKYDEFCQQHQELNAPAAQG